MTTKEVEAFLNTFHSVMIASLTPKGKPYASTAAVLKEGNTFYCLISTVAQHGKNLLVNPDISLLFAEDEALTNQPFARKRVTIEASANLIERDTVLYKMVIEKMAQKFDSDLIASLSQMGDFHLFGLSVLGGSAVSGFGRAYRFDQNLEIISQIQAKHQGSGKHG